jgi:hypothetical protein
LSAALALASAAFDAEMAVKAALRLIELRLSLTTAPDPQSPM